MAYIGSAEDARRIRKQEEQREKQKKEFEDRKRAGESSVDGAGLRQFGAGKAEVLEAALKNETVGLVTREEFMNKRNTIADRLQEEEARRKRQLEAEAAARKAERQRKKQRTQAKSKLSFAEDEDLQEGEEQEPEAGDEQEEAAPRLGKNPDAETGFLPDREREQQEALVRQQLEHEYDLRQEALRSEPLKIDYCYYDGSNHKRALTARRGDSVADFLKKAREQLGADFKEIRNISLSSLMFVKEDMVLPHGITFHELIRRRLRGRTGPLFLFGEHHDVRAFSDSRIQQRTDVHAAKIVTRSYYDRNKHLHPASKWERLRLDGVDSD